MTQAVLEEPAAWTPNMRQAFRPPESMLPSEWAERHRTLTRGQSARAGPWRNDQAPYLRAFMDLPMKRGVGQVNIQKCAQAGGSEALRNLIGYMAHLDPDPIGLALPDRDKGRRIVQTRILPLFRHTPVLRALATERIHDVQTEQIMLSNGFLLHLMWSGSASALSADPMRLAVADEVNKFAMWTGREADPISLIASRLKSFEGRGVAINISTPTTRAGNITVLLEGSDVVLYFFVPCARCGAFQRLVFTQLKWEHLDIADNKKRATAIERRPGAVWYECIHCKGRIGPQERAAMVRAGRWSTEDGAIPDAEAVEEWPSPTRIGMQLSALYVNWIPWAKVVAEFMRAKDSITALFDWYTAMLGEAFEQQVDHAPSEIFAHLAALPEALPEGRVPEWAVKVLLTIDTQADHFYGVARAWGPSLRSARIWHSRLQSFEDLDRICRTPWAFDKDVWPAVLAELILIDSGGGREEGMVASRTMEVYKWVLPRQARVRAVKGASRPRPGMFLWMGRGFLDEGRGKRGDPTRPHLPLWFLDTAHFADELAESIHAGENADGVPRRWWLNSRRDPEYEQHLSAMRKVLVRKGAHVEQEWIVKPSGARHDYWDCEVYQYAAAYMSNVHLLPGDDEVRRFREAEKDARARAEKAPPPQAAGDRWKPRPL